MSTNNLVNKDLNGWRETFLHIIKQIQQDDDSKYFMKAVDEVNDIAPGYYERIENPVNITQLRIDLMKGVIKTPQEFLNKIKLIWENSIKYNGDKHYVTKAAKRIRSTIMKSLKKQYSFSNRVIMNPGNRKSSRLRKVKDDLLEHKEKEYDDHQNKQYMNDIVKNENAGDYYSDAVDSYSFNSTSVISSYFNDHSMPQLEPESPEPILDSSDDAKCVIYEQQIRQLNSRVAELSKELKLVKDEKNDMNDRHINKIRELRISYRNLLEAFNRLNHIVNDINGYIMNQTNIANNIL